MALPHPFKTRRTTGSPSAGGNVHTLAQHMASPTAHPQYVQKGDQIGGASIADHELSAIAHRQYLLRRAELALTIADYAATKNVDTAYYDALHHLSLETAFPVTVTTALLNALMGSNDALETGEFAHILHESQLVHSTTLLDAITATEGQKKLPSITLIKSIYDRIEDFITTEAARDLFALADHDHDLDYAARKHTHDLYDVFIQTGGTKVYPARADHNHDDVYMRRDEVLDQEADLSELGRVGIYPKAVTNQVGTGDRNDCDVNRRNVQGRYSYWFRKNSLTETISGVTYPTFYNFPTNFIDAVKNQTYVKDSDPLHVKNSAETVVSIGNLEVVRDNPGDLFATFETLAGTFGGSPRMSVIGQSVLQKLTTNAAIKNFARTGTDTNDRNRVREFKKAMQHVYMRAGYSYETAHWITLILQKCFSSTAQGFYSSGVTTDLADVVESVAEFATNGINGIFADREAYTLPVGVELGYLCVDSERATGRGVRVSRGMYRSDVAAILGTTVEDVASMSEDQIRTQVDACDPGVRLSIFGMYMLNGRYNSTFDQSQVVLHDLSSWILLGSLNSSSFNTANVFGSIYAANCFIPYSNRYLPYIEYYSIDDHYTGILEFVDPVSVNTYFVQKGTGGSYTYDKLENADVPSKYNVEMNDAEYDDLKASSGRMSELSTCITGELNLDGNSRILHGYLPIHQSGTYYEPTTDTVKRDGKTYYVREGLVYNVFTGDEFVPGVTYYEVHIYNTKYMSDGEYFVRHAEKDSSNLDKFVKLVKGTHWLADGPVGWDKDDHSKELDVSALGADTNQVYLRVAIVQKTADYTPLTADEMTAGPVPGKKYYDGDYELADVSHGFVDGTSYFHRTTAMNYLWSKKPVTAGTPFSSTTEYYGFGGPLSWNPCTDEIASDADNNVIIPSNRVVYVNWSDVYQAELEPQLEPVTPESYRTGLLTRGIFFPTFDTTWVPNKRYYYKKNISGREVFDLYTAVPIGGMTPMSHGGLYECIDVERMLDIWCAIKQLTTEGALQTVGSETIVYNFGEDGDLITWDDWTEVITENDSVYNSVKAIGAENLKQLKDALSGGTPIGEVWTRAHVHANSDVLNLLNANWVTVSGVKTAEYLKFNGKRIAFYSDVYSPTDAQKSLIGRLTDAVIDNSHGHTVLDITLKTGTVGAWTSGRTSYTLPLDTLKTKLPAATMTNIKAEFYVKYISGGVISYEYTPCVKLGEVVVPLNVFANQNDGEIIVRSLDKLCTSQLGTVDLVSALTTTSDTVELHMRISCLATTAYTPS